jgi:hypothetical protein
LDINWNSLLDRTEIKQPLNIQRLSGILTSTNEYRYQIGVKLIHERSWVIESDVVYAIGFSGYLEDDIHGYKVSFNSELLGE